MTTGTAKVRASKPQLYHAPRPCRFSVHLDMLYLTPSPSKLSSSDSAGAHNVRNKRPIPIIIITSSLF